MKEMLFEGLLVKVMCVEPNGVWAMVRRVDYPNSMPRVARVKELSQPTQLAPDVAKAARVAIESGDTEFEWGYDGDAL